MIIMTYSVEDVKFKNFIKLGKKINKILNDKANYSARIIVRKTKMSDGMTFKILYGRKGGSQPKAAAKLNSIRLNRGHADNIHRSSYVDREEQMDINLYQKVFQLIEDHLNVHYGNKLIKSILVVDGTHGTLSVSLTGEGFVENINGEAIDALTLGVYNVTNDFPISLKMTKHKSEIKAYNDFIANPEKYRDTIFLFDRLYWCEKRMDWLTGKGIQYVCRLKDNSLMIKSNTNDYIYCDEDGKQKRIVTYIINGNPFYLVTNILDYDVEKLKQLYHFRWRVEEFFKLLKNVTSFSLLKEKTKNAIDKTIYGQLIVCGLLSLLKKLHYATVEKKKSVVNSRQIINNEVLAQGIYDDFIYPFLAGKMDKVSLSDFLILNMITQTTNRDTGKSNDRTSTIPTAKWYGKCNMVAGAISPRILRRLAYRKKKKEAKIQKKLHMKLIKERKRYQRKFQNIQRNIKQKMVDITLTINILGRLNRPHLKRLETFMISPKLLIHCDIKLLNGIPLLA